MSPISGVIPVDKPAGPTSHDVVAMTRRALGTRRVGHTGTLDPFATGLLLVCVGSATRLAEYLTGLPKSYTATLRLGESTDTDDFEGTVVRSNAKWRSTSREDVVRALERQQGEILQVPPRYSAKKVEGKRSYAVAREGGDMALSPVPVTIHAIRVTRFNPPDVEFEVDCSRGTYIRAIARDAGDELGVGAHLVALRRTRIRDGRGAVVTVGTFDGVHLGHREVLDEITRRAARTDRRSVLVTFHPHPLRIVRPEAAPQLLTVPGEKKEVLAESGVEYAVFVAFTPELQQYSARRFVEEILLGRLGMRELVIGYDHGFGKGREGTVDTMRELGTELGFQVDVVDAVVVGGEAVSSSRIRGRWRRGRDIGPPWPRPPVLSSGTGRAGHAPGPKARLPHRQHQAWATPTS
jgi:tRNA pseudouridine(55) synthase